MKNKFQFPGLDFDPNAYDHDELKEVMIQALEDLAKKGIISPDEYKAYYANLDLWIIQLLETEQ